MHDEIITKDLKFDPQLIFLIVMGIGILFILSVSMYLVVKDDPARFKFDSNITQGEVEEPSDSMHHHHEVLNLEEGSSLSSPYLLFVESGRGERLDLEVLSSTGRVLTNYIDISEKQTDNSTIHEASIYFNSFGYTEGKIIIDKDSEYNVSFKSQEFQVRDFLPGDKIRRDTRLNVRTDNWSCDKELKVFVRDFENKLISSSARIEDCKDEGEYTNFRVIFPELNLDDGEIIILSFVKPGIEGINELTLKYELPLYYYNN